MNLNLSDFYLWNGCYNKTMWNVMQRILVDIAGLISLTIKPRRGKNETKWCNTIMKNFILTIFEDDSSNSFTRLCVFFSSSNGNRIIAAIMRFQRLREIVISKRLRCTQVKWRESHSKKGSSLPFSRSSQSSIHNLLRVA